MHSTPKVVIVGDDNFHQRLKTIVRGHLGEATEVVPVATLEAAREIATSNPIAVLTIAVGGDQPTADEVLKPLVEVPGLAHTRFCLISISDQLNGVSWLAGQGKLHWVTYAPDFRQDVFLSTLDDQLRRYQDTSGRKIGSEPPAEKRFAFNLPLPDSEIIERFVEGVEDYLGPQPRITVPAGVRLTVQGRKVSEILLVQKGTVALIHHRHGEDPTIMHQESTGRIIGLLALMSQKKAFFTAQTTSEVVGIHLTYEQLSAVIRARPEVSQLTAILFIRSLDKRLRRSEQLQLEHFGLAKELAEESELLTEALSNLEQARAELLAQERLASLGSLAAGMAHELNNPMAALARITDNLLDEIPKLLADSPRKEWSVPARVALLEAHDAPALSAREERAVREKLTAITGDPAIAQRLGLAGIHDPSLVAQLEAPGGLSLAGAEAAGSIGSQLRDLTSVTERISELVSSLRSFARPDGAPVEGVDLHQNLNDALRLVSHRLHGIEVLHDYEDLPTITCHPGQLSQVWTNLITNAADALTEAAPDGAAALGHIWVATELAGPDTVRVTVKDDGPGIPEMVLDRIFEPRFTTKSGRVRFGLGIGLSLSRGIVAGHHGTMRIDTSDAGTTVTVDLPVNGVSAEPELPRNNTADRAAHIKASEPPVPLGLNFAPHPED